jgi:catechol 2,3-dioxygenase-like lactoylglutathione lyase family enzyme
MWGYIMSEVGVRYIVSDVDEAILFYTKMLGFQVDMHPAPGFASLSRGDLHLLLNRPGAGGAGQVMPNGQTPAPSGWNRIQIEVEDLAATVEKLKDAGCNFRNEIVVGNSGKQIVVNDPSGNPIELFQAWSEVILPYCLFFGIFYDFWL